MLEIVLCLVWCFFKQKTAYEMRISDWSSDVCSSDLLGSTRATHYRVEMTADDAHVALANALNECRASVVLSGYDAPLYADLFDGWNRVDLQGATTLSGDNDRVEVLWSNRPIGEPDLFSEMDGGAA